MATKDRVDSRATTVFWSGLRFSRSSPFQVALPKRPARQYSCSTLLTAVVLVVDLQLRDALKTPPLLDTWLLALLGV